MIITFSESSFEHQVWSKLMDITLANLTSDLRMERESENYPSVPDQLWFDDQERGREGVSS